MPRNDRPGVIACGTSLESMYEGADRYLIPDQRDFFAMYLRNRSAP